jgi:hypothetical protein
MVWRHISPLCWYVYCVAAGWRLFRKSSSCRHRVHIPAQQADMPPYHWLRHHRRAQNHIYSFNQALGDSLMMVPAWTETCWSFIVTLTLFRVDATSNVHQVDFNKRILILKMHGTNIKKNWSTSWTSSSVTAECRSRPPSSSTSVRPFLNFLHHSTTQLSLITLTPYTRHNRRWISAALCLSAWRKRITARTLQLAGAAMIVSMFHQLTL